MSSVDPSTPSDTPLPKAHAVFSSTSVLETIRALDQLTAPEKSVLENMVKSQDSRLSTVLTSCTTTEQLQQELIRIVRAPAPSSFTSVPMSVDEPFRSSPGDAKDSSLRGVSRDVEMTAVDADSQSSSSETTSSSASASSSSSSSSSASSSSSSSSSAASPSTSPIVEQLLTVITKQNKLPSAISSLKFIANVFSQLRKSPKELKFRRFLEKNPAIKKNITDVVGAKDLFCLMGFKLVDIGGKQFYDLEEQHVNLQSLEAVEQAMQEKLSQLTVPSPSPTTAPTTAPTKPRSPCLGNCGFFGDESREGYCSQCYPKKLTGALKPGAPGASSKCSASGCSNFGSSKFNGLCSSCYTKQQKQASMHVKGSWKKKFRRVVFILRAVHRFTLGKRPKQENTSKCWECNRKVGISGIECRCGYVFCAKHRYPGEHKCAYDYQKAYRKKLAKENQLVSTDKMDKLPQ